MHPQNGEAGEVRRFLSEKHSTVCRARATVGESGNVAGIGKRQVRDSLRTGQNRSMKRQEEMATNLLPSKKRRAQ